MRFFELIGTLIGMGLLLGGCTATAVTMMPTTLAGAILVGLIFLLSPKAKIPWRLFSGGYLVTVVISVIAILFLWAMALQREGNNFPLAGFLLLGLLGLIAPFLSGISLLLSFGKITDTFRRFWCVLLQLVAVIAGWAYSGRLFSLFSIFN